MTPVTQLKQEQPRTQEANKSVTIRDDCTRKGSNAADTFEELVGTQSDIKEQAPEDNQLSSSTSDLPQLND